MPPLSLYRLLTIAAVLLPLPASAYLEEAGPYLKSLAVEAGFNNLPSCAQLCASNMLTINKPEACELNHPACYCQQPQLSEGINSCAAAVCAGDEGAALQAAEFRTQFCLVVSWFDQGHCDPPGHQGPPTLPCGKVDGHWVCPEPDGSCNGFNGVTDSDV